MASAYRKRSKRRSNEVRLTNLARGAAPESLTKRAERAVLSALERSGERVEIFLISGARMRRLNSSFRGVNASTDILSFQHPRGFVEPGRHKPLGEIYLNFSRIVSRDELLMLLIHGTLHLLGFTHKAPRARKRMESVEKRILSKVRKLV